MWTMTARGAAQNRRVEVWSVELAQPRERVADLTELLSGEERERAARMAAAKRWIVARAALRIVLAGRLGCVASAIEFATGPHGKPELAGATALRFNHSHSGDRALVAVATGFEVGVDVERTARRSAVIERTLTEGERASLDATDRHLALLRIWCRKEALAKAGGGGLGWAPEAFDTSRPDGHTLADLDLGAGYVGALAMAGGPAEIQVLRLAL